MARELIPPERFIELANSEIEAHQHFQPGMRLSLGASLPNGSYEIDPRTRSGHFRCSERLTNCSESSNRSCSKCRLGVHGKVACYRRSGAPTGSLDRWPY